MGEVTQQTEHGHGGGFIAVTYAGKPYKLPADGNPFKGETLRKDFGVGADYDLYRRNGHKAELIEPHASIEVKPGDHFFSMVRHIPVG